MSRAGSSRASPITGAGTPPAIAEINDDLHAEGLPLPGDPPQPGKYGLESGHTAETYYKLLPAPPRSEGETSGGETPQSAQDCGSGAHGERRFWELPADDDRDGGHRVSTGSRPSLVRREVARRIDETSPYTTDVSLPWRRWARATLTPKIDYMATIRHAVRRALRDSTLGRIRPHVQAPASPAGLLRRVHHAELLPTATQAGFSDRYVQFDGGFAVGKSGVGVGRPDAAGHSGTAPT